MGETNGDVVLAALKQKSLREPSVEEEESGTQ